jgi:hypothetical protein
MTMKSMTALAIALLLVSAPARAEGIGKVSTTMSFQAGTKVYIEDSLAEGFATLGFGTSGGPLSMWTGLGGTVRLQGTETAFLYPWMLTVASVEALSLGSGALILRPQATLPWSALSYKSPGLGFTLQGDLRLGGSGETATDLLIQGEINYFPPLLKGNPWYAAAKAGGVDAGERYWQLEYGGFVKVRFPGSISVGIDARIESDNSAYLFDGNYYMMPNADFAAMLELPGIAIRAGFGLNGWNLRTYGSQRGYMILPSFSIVLGEVPFFM